MSAGQEILFGNVPELLKRSELSRGRNGTMSFRPEIVLDRGTSSSPQSSLLSRGLSWWILHRKSGGERRGQATHWLRKWSVPRSRTRMGSLGWKWFSPRCTQRELFLNDMSFRSNPATSCTYTRGYPVFCSELPIRVVAEEPARIAPPEQVQISHGR